MIKATLAWTAGRGPVQTSLDVGSIGTVVGALAGWLPAIAAVFSIVWTLIRIYETETVQKLLNRKGDDK